MSLSPYSGLPSMSDIITNEIKTWPALIQTVIEYCKTATILVPFIALLWYVLNILWLKLLLSCLVLLYIITMQWLMQ